MKLLCPHQHSAPRSPALVHEAEVVRARGLLDHPRDVLLHVQDDWLLLLLSLAAAPAALAGGAGAGAVVRRRRFLCDAAETTADPLQGRHRVRVAPLLPLLPPLPLLLLLLLPLVLPCGPDRVTFLARLSSSTAASFHVATVFVRPRLIETPEPGARHIQSGKNFHASAAAAVAATYWCAFFFLFLLMMGQWTTSTHEPLGRASTGSKADGECTHMALVGLTVMSCTA